MDNRERPARRNWARIVLYVIAWIILTNVFIILLAVPLSGTTLGAAIDWFGSPLLAAWTVWMYATGRRLGLTGIHKKQPR